MEHPERGGARGGSSRLARAPKTGAPRLNIGTGLIEVVSHSAGRIIALGREVELEGVGGGLSGLGVQVLDLRDCFG